LARAKQKAQRIQCVNNQKQQGIAYRIWSGDNGDRGGPQQVPKANGGWSDAAAAGSAQGFAWANWTIMANELGQSPKVLVCPADDKSACQNFNGSNTYVGQYNITVAGTFGNTFMSYFIGMGASENYPQSILGGDRNLCSASTDATQYNGYGYPNSAPIDVKDIDTRSSKYCWSLKLHSAGNTVGAGNILLGDGSVQQVSSARFCADLLTNAVPDAGNGSAATNDIRCIFP
jgi:hypothetical protein